MDLTGFHQLGTSLAQQIEQGTPIDPKTPMGARVSAMLLMVGNWTDALDPSQEAVNARLTDVDRYRLSRRITVSELPNLAQTENGELNNKLSATTPNITPAALPAIDQDSSELTQKFGRRLLSLCEGLEPMQRRQIIETASDYAWRKYCVNFHIPKADQPGFS